ncbi:hypothetical protein GGQ13_002973 [Salinibacter ruber]|uniref:hypothetical protein n=1 Tax=Salinibacter ruber TaxID=146919 RepID=UPI002168E793|nr:hypothetical protein [Salinibacter ruber]MCS4139518.1 hypothetical protein [Salinibacter ruber]
MNPDNIKELARKVDVKAKERNYVIADLQKIRREVKDNDLGDRPDQKPTSDIFRLSDFDNDFAFHCGGRNELQFNLKIREYDGERKIRYGVAIRLQPGRSDNLDIKKPVRRRVKLFNHYLEAHREEFSGLGMSYSIRKDDGEKVPSRLFRPHKIPGQLLGEEVTVVLGKREKPSVLTYDDILTLYDELLPLYKYIERNLEPEDSFDSDSFSPPADQKNPLPSDKNPLPSPKQPSSELLEQLGNELNPVNIEELAQGVNRKADTGGYAVADLQDIRMEEKDNDLPDRPDQKPTFDIFRVSDFSDDFVFHCGGRNELQFNLALRRFDGIWKVRYGAAFLYKLGRGMESLVSMVSRIRYFNEYLRANPEAFTGLKLWYEPKGSRKPRGDSPPQEIPEQLLEEGTFFFIGRRSNPSEISYDDILTAFDKLLPLYKYIERNLSPEDFSEQEDSTQAPDEEHLSTSDTYETTAERIAATVSVERTHDRMRDVLAKRLASEHGRGNVHVERSTQHGKSIDLVVQTDGREWFYEVKPFSEPRLCLRKAIGQLLEYAYWSGSETPERLIVVGKSELDSRGEAYLSTLKERFSLPLEYQSVQVG